MHALRCTRLVSLAGLPKTVRVLNVIRCTSLESLEGLPLDGELKVLKVSGCKNLASFQGCPSTLEELVASAEVKVTTPHMRATCAQKLTHTSVRPETQINQSLKPVVCV